MTDQEQRDLRAYCAFLLKEYGFHISPNDPIIPALYIIHKEMQRTSQNSNALASQVKEASLRINPKQFHFQYPGEAWKFQLGAAAKWILIGFIILLFTWVGVWRFFVKKEGVRWATPLFLVVIMVEFTDLIFAVDSIPAILSISDDPFIVYTSNVFAILGLRSLYFALAGIEKFFQYLKYGLAAILIFVGLKMTLADVIAIPVEISLIVIIFILTIAMLASVIVKSKNDKG